MSSTWDDWNAHRWQLYGKAEAIMTDQTKCPECNQPLYVQRDRGVITCLGCLTVFFVQYQGNTPLLHNFGTKQATEKPAVEKSGGNPGES